MAKFRVYISRIEYGSIGIEADSVELAERLGKEAVADGKVVWYDEEISDVSVEEF